jgi:hypothetical protein
MDPQAALAAEQISHALDLMRATIETLAATVASNQKLNDLRLTALEDQGKDHETRIRSDHEGVTQFKFLTGIASVVSTILAIISMLKAFFSGG